MNEELKELVEEMQEFLHKGNKLVSKAKKHLGMPMNGMGQRNFPHDLPPAFPQYPGDYGTYMNRMGNMGERNSYGMGERGGMGQGGYGQRQDNDFDPRYM